MSGFFITFEGIDGCGKSTQVRHVSSRLANLDIPVVATSQPGGTPLGQVLRASILYTEQIKVGGRDIDLSDGGEHNINARTEALLYAADRAHHVHNVIRPALDAGQVVVCDRYTDSSVAYQGTGRGLPTDEVRFLSDWGTQHLKPDLTLILDLPAEAGYQRITRSFDRLETDGMEFMENSRQTYLDTAQNEPDTHAVIDAQGSVEDVSERIWQIIVQRLSAAGFLPANAQAAKNSQA